MANDTNNETNTHEFSVANIERQITEMKKAQADEAKAATAAELQRQLELERIERNADRIEHARQLAELRGEKFVETVQHRVPDVRDESLRLKRDALIKQVGNAKWHSTPVEERLKALGIEETANDRELNELFGPKSSSLKAAALMSSNPARYRRLRQIYQERNAR